MHASHTDNPVTLFGVPPSTHEAIVAALPQCRERHAYVNEEMQFSEGRFDAVAWQSYDTLLAAVGERHFRHTYIDGMLEMMSPSEEHEWIKGFIGRLVETAALELDRPIKTVGSTTRQRPDRAVGLEPDESYYLQHEAEVRGRRTRDAAAQPPPDLVVEVEITRRALDRLEAYARLGVTEVWRYRNGVVEFFCLSQERMHHAVEASAGFPVITATLVTECLRRLQTKDENTVVRSFIAALH